MEKFSCDRRVKCRTASSSLTCGSSGGRARRSAAGRSPSAASPGSCGHWSPAPRPGCEYSKMTFSRSCMVCPSGGERVLQRLTQVGAEAFQIRRGLGFGGTHQQCVTELRVVGREVESADDAAREQPLQQWCDRAVEHQHGFM